MNTRISRLLSVFLLVLAGVAPTRAAVAAPPRALEVTYIANEGFLIEGAGKKVLVDALFHGMDGTYLEPAAETLEAMKSARPPFDRIDLILVTHRHSDHFNAPDVIACLRSNPRCRLVADQDVVGLMRSLDGFPAIEGQIHEVKLEPGARDRFTLNGVSVEAICLVHSKPNVQARNLAFVVELAGTRFLHLGDAFIRESETEATLSKFPFEDVPVDLVFLNQYDRWTARTRAFIAERIKPSRIVAMHIGPAEVEKVTAELRERFVDPIVFEKSLERRSISIDVDFHNLSGAYFGQTPPGATPQVFARGIVSTTFLEHSAPAFSPDGQEVFWYVNRPPRISGGEWLPAMMLSTRRVGDRWTAPAVCPCFGAPTFSSDGQRLYFTSPRRISPEKPDDAPWFVEKQGEAWSEPKCVGLVARFPELRFVYDPTVTSNGTLYFVSYLEGPKNNYGIYRSELVDGEYAKPEPLPTSINLADGILNWTPFIAPDESYLLFSSNRRDPDSDGGDLYLSRRRSDGSWTDPISLGEPVNSGRQERFPAVSPDGKYLFFTRPTPGYSQDVYWVETASVPALQVADKSSLEKSP